MAKNNSLQFLFFCSNFELATQFERRRTFTAPSAKQVMNILFISYWGAREGISSATVIPNLEILSSFASVKKIIFCSIERETQVADPLLLGDKVMHIPLVSEKGQSILVTKTNDFLVFPRQLIRICQEHRIDLILCRSALAGALGYFAHRKLKIPYAVESFEPHGDYMLESGVWSHFDLRLWIQRYFERKIRKTASALLPVSQHYRDRLLSDGVPAEKVILQPCCVSLEGFAFSENDRLRIRETHQILPDAIVGIYAGKFGGIYYEKEAFDLYAEAFHYFGEKFFLIILSADDEKRIREGIRVAHLPEDRVLFTSVPHHEVRSYLSAADFAFSTIKPAPSRIYCSPIKDGEYWANGLPIVIEDHIGDDSAIIQQEGGGVILDRANPGKAFAALSGILKPGRREVAGDIQPIAVKYRRLELVKDAYESLLHRMHRKLMRYS